MKEVYADTAEAILRLRSHRDPLIRKTVITLIPTLAMYDTQSFSELFMHRAMAHLLEQLQKPNERSFGRVSLIYYHSLTLTRRIVAFIAIGHVAKAVGSDMKAFLEQIMEQIKLGLQARGYVHKIGQPNSFPLILLHSLQEEIGPCRGSYVPMRWHACVCRWTEPYQAST